MSLLHSIYRSLLRLLPGSFYQEFADEMAAVFAQVMEEAGTQGPAARARAALRELVSLPGEALRLHLARRAGAANHARPAGWEGPPSRREILLGLGIFGLPILGLFFPEGLQFPARGPAYLVIGLVLGVLLAGLWRGVPRWSLPYLGLVLSVTTFVAAAEWSADLSLPAVLNEVGLAVPDGSAWLLLEVVWSGLLWLGLFAVTGMVLGLLALLNRSRTIAARIRQDWTLASYVLYGGVLAALALSFTRHRASNLYAVASCLCLGIGAWVFLRSPRAWQRSLSLVGGLTLAVFIAAAGQWPLHPLYGWEAVLRLEVEGWPGLRMAVLEWGWMAAVILAPGLLRLIPPPRAVSPGIS